MPTTAQRLAAELATARRCLAALEAVADRLERLLADHRREIAAGEQAHADYLLATIRAGCRVVNDVRTDEWAAVVEAVDEKRRRDWL